MKTIWINSILDFFKKINSKTLAFIVGALLVLFMMKQCNTISNLKDRVEESQVLADNNFNNYLAARDSVQYFRNELGNTIAEVSSYQFQIDDLSKTNLDLRERYIKALSLNKELRGVNMLLSADIKIKDSIIANTFITGIDSTTSLISFNKSDDYGNGNTRVIRGSLSIKYDTLNRSLLTSPVTINMQQTLSLSAAIENIEGRNKLKMTSSYPGLTISKIENINLVEDRLNDREEINKKAGFSVGMGVGYGINLNPTTSTISYGPTINVGLYWSPAWLRF